MFSTRISRRRNRWIPALFLAALPAAALADEDRMIVPGHRVGPLVAGMTEEALIAALPAGQVRRTTHELEEGSSTCGTLVLAGTADAFFVAWRDAPVFDFPNAATDEACAALPPLRNPVETTITQGRWRTAEGIAIGIAIDTLARIAGRPVSFSVCGCDFRGRVFEGAPEGMSVTMDWPNEAEKAITIAPRHEADYAITAGDIAPSERGRFFVSELRIDLRNEP